MENRFIYNWELIIKKPPVLLRALKNYLFLFMGGERLRSVEIDLGFGCQLNCKHCYASDLINPKRKSMSLEEIRKSIDQCIGEGAIHFLISGGEPLIHKQVFEVIKYINKKNAFSCLATNGVALNKESISKLKKSGLNIIEISLDSSLREKHDKNRKRKGLYDHVLKATSMCKKQGITVFASSVITNDNLNNNDLIDIIRLGKTRGIRTHLCFPVSMGNWRGKKALLTKKNKIKIKGLFKKEDIRCCEEGNYLKQGCSAGIEKICINPYGDVLPCPYIQASFGNITKENLSNILRRMRQNKYFKKIDGPCLPAFNNQFIKEIMFKINKAKKRPLDLSE